MRLLILLFCWCFPFICLAQKPIVVTKDFEPFYIGAYCSTYEDPTKVETIHEVRHKKNTEWISENKAEIMGEISASNFWVRCKIKNPNNHKVSLAFAVENSYLDKVQFFYFKNQILIDSSRIMGDLLPFSERKIAHRYFIHEVTINAKETWEVYCLSNKRGGKMELSLKLYTADNLLPKLQENLLKTLSVLILIILSILVGFLFFLVTKESTAIFFALQNLSILLWLLGKEGLGFQYLWPTATTFQQGATILFFSFCFLFQSLLILSLFRISRKSMVGQLIFFAIIIQLTGIGTLLSTLLFEKQQVIPFYTWISYYTHGAALLTILLTLLGCILYLLKNPNWEMRLLILAYVLQFSSIIISLASWLTSNYFNITFIYEFMAITGSIQSLLIFYLIAQEYARKSRQNETLQLQFSKEQNQALQNLLIGQEKERKRLSQELHDGLSIRIAQLKQQISTNKQDGISQNKVPRIIKKIDNIHKDVRYFSHALNPVVLDQLGFKKAIDNIIFNLENTYIELDIQFDVPITLQLSKAQEKHFYHIIQELLNNTIKHAQANTIHIQFVQSTDSLKFTYEDNGIGFDTSKKKNGIGLQNIQARTELLRGTFNVKKLLPIGMRQTILLSN